MDRMTHGAAQRPPEHHHSQKNTPRTTPAPLPAFLPPTAQPPVQIPFSDPFHNRDPFLPNSQHQRRGSYGPLGGAPLNHYGGERAWTNTPGQGPPPPHAHLSHHHQPQHPTNGHPAPSGPYDSARRQSVGAQGSPPRYVGGPLDPPPPPSFAARNMPPPSPSSNPAASFGVPRGPPSASPFTGVRDLPGFAPRPGGGLSISSLIGNDSARKEEQSPKAATANNSPTFRSSRNHSPQRPRSTSVRSDVGHFHYRPPSPRQMEHSHLNDGRPSHDGHRMLPHPPAPYPNAAMFRPYQSSPTSANGEINPPNIGQGPPRPNSQPMSVLQEPGDNWRRVPVPAQKELSGFRNFNQPSFRAAEGPHPHPHAEVADSRFMEDAPRRMPSPDYARAGVSYPPQFRSGPAAHSRDEYAGHFRPAYPPHGPPPEAQHAQIQETRHRDRQQPSPAPSETVAIDGRFRHFGPSTPFERDEKLRAAEAARQNGGEDAAGLHRSFLNVSPELNRKNGRASPLPQAVQGAQPRPGLAGRDASVKNEFGRMFSGLGSGVGGTGTPIAGISANGASTPSRIMSPTRFNDTGEAMQSTEADQGLEGSGPRNKNRRAYDDNESLDGRNTPTAGHKGGKRGKANHASHHHHHHQHAHAHHHHHHHHEEHAHHGAGSFSTLRFPSNPNGTQPGATTAHHHHHHHATHPNHPHHHHHAANKTPVPVNAPETVVHDHVMQTIAHLPRLHLGSTLYSTSLSNSSYKHTTLESKLAFESTPKTIPRLDGKENCTYTIRVPREYIRSSDRTEDGAEEVVGGLDEICRRRAIWGTTVYTDDSDVVAAAVHSGWIKGDFGEYNEDLRDVFNQTQDEAEEESDDLNEKPTQPARIPRDLDMHVTILILPPLQKYSSSVMHNLHSRSWGNDHDGMSFMIHRIEFVDEPRFSRHSERGPVAKKRRMAEEQRRKEAAETLMGLFNGGRDVPVGA